MCQVSVKCPHCGTVNKNMYLDETEGWFECEKCGIATRVPGLERLTSAVCAKYGCEKIPVYDRDGLPEYLRPERRSAV